MRNASNTISKSALNILEKNHLANQFNTQLCNKTVTNPPTIAQSGALDEHSIESIDLANYWNKQQHIVCRKSELFRSVISKQTKVSFKSQKNPD